MNCMFNHCHKLEYLNINNFLVKNNCETTNIFINIEKECKLIVYNNI